MTIRTRCCAVFAAALLSSFGLGQPLSAQDHGPGQTPEFGLVYPLGWKENELFAYARYGPIDLYCADCPRPLSVVVQNLVTDRIEYRHDEELTSHASTDFQEWWSADAMDVKAELRALGIRLEQRGRAVTGNEIVLGEARYQVLVSAGVEQKSVPGPIGGPVSLPSLSEPELLVILRNERTGAESWKRVHSGPSPQNSVATVLAAVSGIVLSPDGSRAAIVYRWTSAGAKEERDFTLVGAHLGVGFREGLPESDGRLQLLAVADAGKMSQRSLNPPTEIVDIATRSLAAVLGLELDESTPTVHPELGYYTVFSSGVLIDYFHNLELSGPSGSREPPSEETIRSIVMESQVQEVQGVDFLSQWSGFREDSEAETQRIALIEETARFVLVLDMDGVHRLVFSQIDGSLYLTIVDEVDPNDA